MAYLPLAHFAGTRHSPTLAVLALGDLALLVLIEALLRRRLSAWLALAASVVALVLLARTPYALTPLLLVPSVFTAMIGGWFARSLRAGREPLIAKVVGALYAQAGMPLTPRHRSYTRQLTLAWALLLAAMTLLNLALALIAVPDGVLAQFGIVAPVTVTGAQWSWIANIANYGVMGGFMLVEFQLRKRVFPVRPYRNAFDFGRRMAALGPAFWRDFFH
ncbi:MAG: ketosynthase [Lysobacter sp.]|nr:ketosynthase [Lysobacter sp.]